MNNFKSIIYWIVITLTLFIARFLDNPNAFIKAVLTMYAFYLLISIKINTDK